MGNFLPSRIRRFRGVLAATLLSLVVLSLPAPGAFPDNGALPGGYEQRATAEKASRSRYRLLEWTSVVLILACGGAVILWVVRRK